MVDHQEALYIWDYISIVIHIYGRLILIHDKIHDILLLLIHDTKLLSSHGRSPRTSHLWEIITKTQSLTVDRRIVEKISNLKMQKIFLTL